jgi:two-component system, OmpR family, sensor histidine kinase KdpD
MRYNAVGTRSYMIETPRLKRSVQLEFGNWRGYILGIVLVALATILGRLLLNYFNPANLVMFYLIGVTITAITSGLVPSILISLLSVLAFDFFLVPPYLTFTVADTQYIVTFIALFVVGVVISYLMTRIRQQTEIAVRREHETATLYSLSRSLTFATGLDNTLQKIILGARETFKRNIVILLPNSWGALKPYSVSPDFAVNENEMSVILQSFQRQTTVGQGTDIMSGAGVRCVPLKTSRGLVGIMALKGLESPKSWNAEQTQLLEVFADLAALVIEHNQLIEEARNAQILEATEKLQAALLNSISHDLRTPLVSVIGVLSSLQEEGMNLDDATKSNLIQVAREQAEYLNHTITNLLDVSRVEAGVMKISRQLSAVQDLIGAALEQMGSRIRNYPVTIEIPEEIPFISVDFGLIVQTFVNVLDNTLKYSPANSPIDIKARQVGNNISIEIADRGIGIPPDDLSHVFDKFYRLQKPNNVPGTGLGLSICKGIIEAHSGHIFAHNRPGGGTIINIILPITAPIEGRKSP